MEFERRLVTIVLYPDVNVNISMFLLYITLFLIFTISVVVCVWNSWAHMHGECLVFFGKLGAIDIPPNENFPEITNHRLPHGHDTVSVFYGSAYALTLGDMDSKK